VQHGASTLPPEVFDKFPATGTAEIHLATEFQNMIYDRLPKPLVEEIHSYLREHCKDEMKAGQTDEQFIYKTRKKAIGPFKKRLWGLSDDIRQGIGEALEAKFASLFKKLNVVQTQEVVRRFVQPIPIPFTVRDEIVAAEAEGYAHAKEESNPNAD